MKFNFPTGMMVNSTHLQDEMTDSMNETDQGLFL